MTSDKPWTPSTQAAVKEVLERMIARFGGASTFSMDRLVLTEARKALELIRQEEAND